MSAPIILCCPYVSIEFNEMDIADELWHSSIAWVSMVTLSKTEDPEFNTAYIEISGWLSDWRSGQHDYESFGTIDTPIGVFSEVSKTYNYSRAIREINQDRIMEFPLQYYITFPGNPYREPEEAERQESLEEQAIYEEYLRATEEERDERQSQFEDLEIQEAIQEAREREQEEQRAFRLLSWCENYNAPDLNQDDQDDCSSVEEYSWDKPNFTGRIIPEDSPLMKRLFPQQQEQEQEPEPKKERYISPLVLENLAEKYIDSEWKTVGLAAHYGYNVYDEF